jgi:hypothetical protein
MVIFNLYLSIPNSPSDTFLTLPHVQPACRHLYQCRATRRRLFSGLPCFADVTPSWRPAPTACGHHGGTSCVYPGYQALQGHTSFLSWFIWFMNSQDLLFLIKNVIA